MTLKTLSPALLKFTALSWQIRDVSRSGGVSLTGSEQVVSGPAGRWHASLTMSIGAMAWNGSEELLLFRGLLASLRGRARVWDVPYFDGRGPGQLLGLPDIVPFDDGSLFDDGTGFGQGSVPVLLRDAAALNAVEVILTYPTGVQPHPGQVFSLPATAGGSWMHAIGELVARSGNDWTVMISPWLREDYAAGVAVEVDRPKARMRLASDESGALTIQAGQVWSNPTLELVEAF